MISDTVKPRLGADDQDLQKNDTLQACVVVGISEAELVEMCFSFT